MKIYIIMGSTRPERKNEAITQWLYSLAKHHESKDITFEIIDLRDYPLPFYNEPVGASDDSLYLECSFRLWRVD